MAGRLVLSILSAGLMVLAGAAPSFSAEYRLLNNMSDDNYGDDLGGLPLNVVAADSADLSAGANKGVPAYLAGGAESGFDAARLKDNSEVMVRFVRGGTTDIAPIDEPHDDLPADELGWDWAGILDQGLYIAFWAMVPDGTPDSTDTVEVHVVVHEEDTFEPAHNEVEKWYVPVDVPADGMWHMVGFPLDRGEFQLDPDSPDGDGDFNPDDVKLDWDPANPASDDNNHRGALAIAFEGVEDREVLVDDLMIINPGGDRPQTPAEEQAAHGSVLFVPGAGIIPASQMRVRSVAQGDTWRSAKGQILTVMGLAYGPNISKDETMIWVCPAEGDQSQDLLAGGSLQRSDYGPDTVAVAGTLSDTVDLASLADKDPTNKGIFIIVTPVDDNEEVGWGRCTRVQIYPEGQPNYAYDLESEGKALWNIIYSKRVGN